MIKFEIDKDKCANAEMEGTSETLVTEVSCLVSHVYMSLLDGAMTSENLKGTPKPRIHKVIRELFLKNLATAFAVVDSEIMKKYIGDPETEDFLSDFMKKLMEEDDDSENN